MKRSWVILLAALAVAGCGGDRTTDPAPVVARGKPTVAASNYPLAYFAERLAGDLVTVSFPVPAGEDPAFWQPSESDIAILQRADAILINGADYEYWLRTTTLPEDRVINTSQSFADAYIKGPHTVTHSHGPEGAHEHGVMEFTTWLDPRQAIQQVAAVQAALARVHPAGAETFAAQDRKLVAELEALDARLAQAAQAWGSRPLLASHPVYSYLARRYNLKLESVHWEPGELPPDEEWSQLATLRKTHAATVMLWEDEPLPETRARLQAAGVACVLFRPCGNRPPAGDFLSEMRANAERLDQAARSAQP